MVNSRLATLTAWAALQLAAPSACGAHDPGLSSTIVTLGRAGAEAVMRFDAADLLRGTATPAAGALRLRADGREIEASYAGREDGDDGHVILRLRFPAHDVAVVHIAVPLLGELAFGHKHYLEVRRGNRVAAARILSAGSAAAAVDLETVPTGEAPSGGGAARTPGHAAAGYDNVIFGLVLTVGAAAWAAHREPRAR